MSASAILAMGCRWCCYRRSSEAESTDGPLSPEDVLAHLGPECTPKTLGTHLRTSQGVFWAICSRSTDPHRIFYAMTDTDPITRLNAALEGRYRIERELGEESDG